jgi:hypothetical protein
MIGAAWRAMTRIEAEVEDLVQRTRDSQAQVGYSVVERLEVGWCCVRSAPCTRRWGALVSWFSLKTKVNDFSRFCRKTAGYGSCGLTSKPLTWVSGLGLKTGSCGMVIWPTKSQLWFLSLSLKTKWAMVYRLRHKIDVRWRRCGTHVEI